MSPLYMILSVAYIFVCLGLMTVIMFQKKRSAGLGAGMSGMGATPQTYWDKNKGRSEDGRLLRATKILGTAFIVLSLVLTLNMFL